MSKTNLSRFSLCSSCRNILLKPSSQSRSFTSTPQRAKIIPSFTPTSSRELNSLLLTWRTQVFTPAALSQTHRDLIYKKSRQQILLNDPGVTVTLSNDEEVKLEPMNLKDRPAKRSSLLEFLRLIQETGDWSNLAPFLEGLRMANEKVPDSWLERVIRKANECGKTGVIVRCAEMVKKTGLGLSNQRCAEELMLGFHLSALKANWQGEQMDKACRQAEQIALMMEAEEHCGGQLKEGMVDMRRSSAVVGVLVELYAAKVLHSSKATKEEKDKVKDYASKAAALSTNLTVGTPHEARKQMERWLPLWNGVQMSLKINEVSQGDVAGKLRTMMSKLEAVIHEVRNTLIDEANGKQRRPLLMYNTIRK